MIQFYAHGYWFDILSSNNQQLAVRIIVRDSTAYLTIRSEFVLDCDDASFSSAVEEMNVLFKNIPFINLDFTSIVNVRETRIRWIVDNLLPKCRRLLFNGSLKVWTTMLRFWPPGFMLSYITFTDYCDFQEITGKECPELYRIVPCKTVYLNNNSIKMTQWPWRCRVVLHEVERLIGNAVTSEIEVGRIIGAKIPIIMLLEAFPNAKSITVPNMGTKGKKSTLRCVKNHGVVEDIRCYRNQPSSYHSRRYIQRLETLMTANTKKNLMRRWRNKARAIGKVVLLTKYLMELIYQPDRTGFKRVRHEFNQHRDKIQKID